MVRLTNDEVGLIAGGRFGEVILRKDSGKQLEIGQLLVYEKAEKKVLFKVYDLVHSSTLPQNAIDMAQGYVREEEGPPLSIYDMDEKISYFTKGLLKPLIEIREEGSGTQILGPKSMPSWWEGVREVRTSDLYFLQGDGTYLGKLRNGSRVMDIDIKLPTDKLIPHHVLIAASTGKGKSNLVKVMLWSIANEGKAGAFVIDPHGEYWGFHEKGLRLLGEKAVLLSPNPPPGGISLKINVRSLLPDHFSGVSEFTEAQREGLESIFRQFKQKWIEELLSDSQESVEGVKPATIAVLRRKMRLLLGLGDNDEGSGPFSTDLGEETINSIIKYLDDRKVVVVDTSSLEEGTELLISNIVADLIMKKHQRAKAEGLLDSIPPVAIIIEEAARVLSEGVEPNVLKEVAREGRKFKVGLIAITQLPSLIQKELIANMNTKIILGNEAKSERDALVNSSAQDLSNEEQEIASLDLGEGIVTSSFLRMAVPIKVPLFDSLVKAEQRDRPKLAF